MAALEKTDKANPTTSSAAGQTALEAGLEGVGRPPRSSVFEKEAVLGYTLLIPAVVIILGFKAYPFFLGIWFSLTSKIVGEAGSFIGLENFYRVMQSQIFWQTAWNTVFFTTCATILKATAGMWLALLLHRKMRFARVTRAIVLLPWVVPTVLSGLAWVWMFDATFSVFNWMLNWVWQVDISVFDVTIKERFPGRVRINWLGDPALAMMCVIIVNAWRGMPFFAISFLAGLQTVPQDLYDAGNIDGTNAWQRFRNITLPTIMPIAVVVTVFSIVVTFADFEVVYVLTRGGPHNSTHLFATYAYQLGMDAGNLGQGAAVALFMLPILAVLIVWQLLYLRREDTR